VALIETVAIDDANKRAITMNHVGRHATSVNTDVTPDAAAMTVQRTTVSADVPAMTARMTRTAMPTMTCVAAVATGVASAMSTTVTTAAVSEGNGAQQQAKGYRQSGEYAALAARTPRGRPSDHVLDPL
jgi:hypothetical protein